MIKKLVLISVIGFSAIIACKHHPDLVTPIENSNGSGNGNGGGGSSNGIPCSKDTVYFNRDILPLLNSNCAFSGCHNAASAQDGVILDNYVNIINTGKLVPYSPSASELIEVINETKPNKVMPPPPNATLSPAQKELLRKWIAQGAKNNYCTECDTSSFKFNLNIMPILQSNCLGCHSGGNLSGGVSLANYNDVKTALTGNRLLNAINWSGSKNMPPSGKLQDCKIKIIKKWIDNGAPND